MSTACSLISFLFQQFTAVQPDNVIMRLEQAMMASKCGLSHVYQILDTTIGNKPGFEGQFILGQPLLSSLSEVSHIPLLTLESP